MIVGVTGHQELQGKSVVNWIKTTLIKEIRLREDIVSARSCLAIGADQIFAKIIIANKIDLVAVIPSYHYEETFNGKNRNEYSRLLALCERVKQIDFPHPCEHAFMAAGKEVAQDSDVLFAIWNGKPARGLGGTGDIVEYALSIRKTVVHLNPISKTKVIYNDK